LNTAAETIVFAGGGSKNPSLMMWPKPCEDAKPLIISQFNRGYSVYALAISPNGTRIAAGTKAGLLQVHGLSNFQASENSPPLFEIFHPPSVVSLAFCTDNILASGGLDGKIKVWSVSEKRQLAEIPAHPDGVFALRQLGSLILASVGEDNVLRVWDMDTLEVKFESDPVDLPKIRALIPLDYNSINGLLMHPSRNGALHLYNPHNNFTMHIVNAHNGDFCALAYGGEYVVTAGLEDTMIKLWSSSVDKLITEASAPLGVLAVSWIGIDSIITVYNDGSGQIWKIDGELSPGPRFVNLDLRSIIGLPVDLVARDQLKSNRQWRDKKLFQAKESFADSGSHSQIAGIVDELRHRGFSVEAGLILADTAKAQKQPLWELESCLALVEGLGNSQAVLPSLYALGGLLRKLKEPGLVQDYFKKILQIDENYLDVKEQIDNLQSDPLMHLCSEKDVRGDLMQKGQVLQELGKYTILNKEFSWRVVVKTGKTLFFNTHLNTQDAVNSISMAVEKYEPATYSVGLSQGRLFTGKELKDTTWIYVSLNKTDMPIAFALGIHSTTRGSELIPYEFFDTKLLPISTEMSARKHNQQVEKAWLKLQRSSDSKNWLRNIGKVSIESISQLGGKSLARTDDEY